MAARRGGTTGTRVGGVLALGGAGVMAYAGLGPAADDAVVFLIVAGLFAAVGLAMLFWPRHWYDGPPDSGGG